ncbi:FKBP_C domain-containing protein/TPR_1 domain-containing protein/TPR_11 domain-containing protein [Cephalotus follicularis]|uniref:peptidylprolyl isomerase n=1 Tax=Cephalotus follicularis TaxID=3775 RepID=A0A1Q3ALP5_CEPFO|nr:FKBP_C domain-containing protein/TPR_1 domain-containing protein/TPR_11 domain-containing protein [Cephalotus follicularis]
MGAQKGEGHVSDIEDDEEPGEVIESAPPLKVGEERELTRPGLKKKLLKRGRAFETPEFGDEVTVHYVGTFLDGTTFDSTRDRDEPLTFKLGGDGVVVAGLNYGIITMKRGECALFTVPPELGYGVEGHYEVPPNSVIQFEVELISWITVVDVSKDGGIIKKIMEKGERNELPGDLDEVLVKYQVALVDGTVVARTPEEGIEFCVKDGHLCQALPKAIRTLKSGEKARLIVQPQYAFGGEEWGANNGIHTVPLNSVLNIDLELVSFKPVVDVTGDSKVLKKILKEGEGAFVANEDAAVTIRYTARLEDGTIFEKKGVDGDQPFVFTTDEEQVVSGLDRAAATMKKGERAVISIDFEYGFGSVEVKRDLATIPPCSKLLYEVEMLDFIKEKAPWEMISRDKIEAAERKKEEANLLFKSGKYQRAGKKYDKAADYVSEDGSFGDEEQKQAKALRLLCWLNGAACSLKLNDFLEAINLCSKVLDIEFCNVKALYRRAQAYMETADLVLAGLDIKKALEVDPQNREVKSIQKTLIRLQAESNKRDTKLYMKMFAHMTKGPSVATKKLKVENADDEKREKVVAAMEMEKVADSSATLDNGMVADC